MKVRLVSSEYFSWGIYGGYGAFTRKLGAELVKKGVEVEVVVQKISSEQKPVGKFEIINDVKVIALPRGKLAKFRSKLYKTDADIIHSQSERLDTYYSFSRNPNVKKVITFQDPWTPQDYRDNAPYLPHKSYAKRLWNSYVEYLYSKAVKMADATLTQAKFKIPAIQQMYKVTPAWQPNMVDVPDESEIRKSSTPIVVFSNRLDPIKRPEIFCNLAKSFPDVEFYCLGKTNFGFDKSQWQNVKNLHFTGFISQEEKYKLLSKSWVSVNCSIYECLPVAFLEACAYKCAILSEVNPDDFANNFGYCAEENPYWYVEGERRFYYGLDTLLTNNKWQVQGEKGYKFVKEYCNTPIVINQHIKMYEGLLKK